jgi:hypothetical protein
MEYLEFVLEITTYRKKKDKGFRRKFWVGTMILCMVICFYFCLAFYIE